MTIQRIIAFVLLMILLSSCASAAAIPSTQTMLPTQSLATATTVPTAIPTSTATPTATLAPMTDFMEGLVYFPAGWGGDQRPETDWTLENVVLPTGANWIRLHVGCYQEGVQSTAVTCDQPGALSDDEYLYLVRSAHRLGLRVMTEHFIDSSSWTTSWSGEIGDHFTEQQWTEWFASYGEMVLHYGELAESAGTDYLIISSELDSTTHREKEWRELIARVRQVYHGKISMAYSEEQPLQEVQFWDALDAIDIHPYYLDLPNVVDPTSEQLTAAFSPYADRLEALSKKWNKPILISEIGFWSVHTASQNYNNLDSSNQIDLQEQTDLYKAVFNTFYGKPWVAGIFWYAFQGGSNYGEPWNIHNDFIGKPAEDIIRSFYGGSPRPTSTPVVFPSEDLPNNEIIYDDQLAPFWDNYPPEGDPANIQFDQSEIAVSGNAIKVRLQNFWSLDLRNDAVDWNKYQWLDFDLYVDPTNLPKVYTIGVTLRDTSYQPSLFKVELLQSQFIEAGKLQPGSWQHVQIPLDVFGPRLSQYGMISIDRPGHGSNTPLMIYVDNLTLRGNSSAMPSVDAVLITPTMSVVDMNYYYDEFNDTTYDGSINKSLWTVSGSSSSATAIQQDGVLVLSDQPQSTGESLDLAFKIWEKPTFGFLEARIKVQYEEGSNGNITLDAISPAFPQGWSEMGFTPRPSGAKLHVDAMETRVLNDTWYVLRIEFHEDTDTLLYFIDGKQIESYVLPEKATEMYPGIQLWHPTGSFVTAYIDYVAIGE